MKLKNKKGFTTIELVLTITLVALLLTSITSVTLVYQEKSKEEQLRSDLLIFKNTVTKIIYDEVLDIDNPVVNIEFVNSTVVSGARTDNWKFTRLGGETFTLQASSKGIKFDGALYETTKDLNSDVVEFVSSNLNEDNDNVKILTIDYKNTYNDDDIKIRIVLS